MDTDQDQCAGREAQPDDQVCESAPSHHLPLVFIWMPLLGSGNRQAPHGEGAPEAVSPGIHGCPQWRPLVGSLGCPQIRADSLVELEAHLAAAAAAFGVALVLPLSFHRPG